MNLTPLDLNPGIAKCEVSVAYEGPNRNGSYIDHEAMESLAKSLRGTPIVGFFDETAGDFADHDVHMKIRDGEAVPYTRTIPLGFVPTDARVWFQDVVPTSDDFDQDVRTYLMTEGYLWVRQFPYAASVVSEGRPQSMELDESTVNGSWAEVDNSGYEFFIIEEGTRLSKLCILGKQVPPCFEDAAVTAPNSGTTFSLNIDASCAEQLRSMMEELKYALRGSEGGLHDMKLKSDEVIIKFEEKTEDTVEETEGEGSQDIESGSDTVFSESEEDDKDGSEGEEEGEDEAKEPETEPESKPKDDEDEDEATRRRDYELEDEGSAEVADEFEQKKEDDEEKPAEDEEEVPTEKKDEDDEYACGGKKRKYSLSDEEIDAIIAERDELRAFKLGIENSRKDALIDKYYMLDDEDKADVIANKERYSLEEIEEKLALAYVRKNVDFSTIDNGDNDEKNVSTTFSFDTHQEFVSPVAQALREARRNSKNH